jgi:hypothetical protein
MEAGPVLLLFPLAVLAGGLATLAMDLVMARLPEGETPPTVAAGVLTGTNPRTAPKPLSKTVHYLAGVLTGPLFAWLLLAGTVVLGGGVLTTLVAAAGLLVLMVGFFVGVVLPRARGLTRRQRKAVGRDWALSAAAYVAVLVPLVAGVAALV